MKQLLNTCHTFLGMDTSYEESEVVIFGAPFDGTTSYRPGTRFAAKQMRVESDGIETYSPRLDLDLEDYKISDIGDIDLSNGNTVKILSEIEQVVERTLSEGKKPFMIGGEHLVTLPAVQAILNYHPDTIILHFDAHTDLRQTYNNEALSHATVIRRVWDLVGDHRIYQFGIRSGMKEEFDFALKLKHTTMEPFTLNTLPDVLKTLANKKVYITIDLDVLDPSVFAGTGTPEPGGITFKELEQAFTSIQQSNIELVGADIVELSPHYDQSGVSTIVACKVLRELALLLATK